MGLRIHRFTIPSRFSSFTRLIRFASFTRHTALSLCLLVSHVFPLADLLDPADMNDDADLMLRCKGEVKVQGAPGAQT